MTSDNFRTFSENGEFTVPASEDNQSKMVTVFAGAKAHGSFIVKPNGTVYKLEDMVAKRMQLAGIPLVGNAEDYPTYVERLEATVKAFYERSIRNEKWRELVVDLTRCVHGRVQGDDCYGCKGVAPDVVGRQVGTSLRGRPITIPTRDYMNKPEAWYADNR